MSPKPLQRGQGMNVCFLIIALISGHKQVFKLLIIVILLPLRTYKITQN